MKVEIRRFTNERGVVVSTALVLAVENEGESKLLDEVFGKTVHDGGLIGTLTASLPAECRLADGYGQHYVMIKNEPLPMQRATKALEFAEYLAKDGERLLDAINAYDEAAIGRDEGNDQISEDDMDRLLESRGEFMSGLRSGIHEFRKRAEKVNG